MADSRIITQIYNARKTLMDLLKTIGYITTDYEDFDINNINILMQTNQLNMVLKNENKTTLYVKYSLNKTNWGGDSTFINTINEIFNQSEDDDTKDNNEDDNEEEIIRLKKTDTLMMIVENEPTDKIKEILETMYENFGYFIVIHTIKRLQFNVLKHKTQPTSFRIITSNKEKDELKIKYNINDIKDKLPQIPRFDPYSLAICLRPDDVLETIRPSINNPQSISYHVCV